MFLGSFTEKEKSAFYALAKGLIAADEVLDERETSLMEEYLEEMKISFDDLSVMTPEAAIETFCTSEKTVRRQAYIELVSLSMADENFDETEKAYLAHVAEGLDLSKNEADALAACVSELFRVYEKMGSLIAGRA